MKLMEIPNYKYIIKYKKLILLALVLATINQIFSLLDPQIIRILLDDYALKVKVIPSNIFYKGVLLLLLGFIGVSLVSRIAKNFQDYFVDVITENVGTEMYSDAVSHTFSLPYSVFEDQRSGEVLEKMQKARSDAQKLIKSGINVMFLSLVGIIFVTAYAFYVHWLIGLSFIILIPIMGVLMFSLSKKIKKSQKEIVSETTDLAGSTTETIRNVELVKSLGLESQEINRLNSMNKKILGLELKKVKYIRMLSFIQGTLINTMRVVLIFLMFFLLYNELISVGEFLTLFIYSFFIFSPLSELSGVVNQYQETKASKEKLDEILNLKPEEKPKDAVNIIKIDSIKFEKLNFSYSANSKPSVSDITLEIKKGEAAAFVGLSGSGKTTLVKLILGLYKPSSGKLTYNDIDSKKVDFGYLRKKIGLVSQDTQLFAGTFKENLLFVNPNATDEECLDALKRAACLSVIDRGNKGLHTKIGEGGIKLSGGEKQRLAIARALLRTPDILIFDEATSSLDSLTEKEISKTIKEISKSNPNLITIMVAHRLSTINHADKIYVLEKSKIIESGNHESLLKKKGLYAALWREQIGQNGSI